MSEQLCKDHDNLNRKSIGEKNYAERVQDVIVT